LLREERTSDQYQQSGRRGRGKFQRTYHSTLFAVPPAKGNERITGSSAETRAPTPCGSGIKVPLAIILALALCFSALLRANESEPKIVGMETSLGKLETGTIASEMRLSPDGKRIAQLVVRDEQYFIAINDQMSPAYDGVTKDSLRFSPDGKRYCYGARIGDRKFVIVDGKEYSAFDGSAAGMPVFSPDSQHFAYIAVSVTTMSLIVDGREVYRDERFVKDSLGFDGSNSLHVLTLRDGQIIRARFDVMSIPSNPLTTPPNNP
jgi:hypothetical protein